MAKSLSERQREHFNNIENSYEQAVNDTKSCYFRRLVYRQFFKNTSVDVMLNGKNTISVLEAMCGDGMGLRVLKSIYRNAKMDYEGFDYSDEMVKDAKNKYPNINFYQQDVNTFTSKKEYDVIILMSGLHHVPQTAANVMKKMHSYLKDDGCFISVEPTYNFKIAGIIGDKVYQHSRYYDYGSERRFSLKELNTIFNYAGFSIEKQFYPGMLAYLLWWFNPYPLLLKIGNNKTVKALYSIERKMYCNVVGKKLSLATFTILKK